MRPVRCMDCRHFQPEAASLRMGTCLQAEPWDGRKEQFARDQHSCEHFAPPGVRRRLSLEKLKKL